MSDRIKYYDRNRGLSGDIRLGPVEGKIDIVTPSINTIQSEHKVFKGKGRVGLERIDRKSRVDVPERAYLTGRRRDEKDEKFETYVNKNEVDEIPIAFWSKLIESWTATLINTRFSYTSCCKILIYFNNRYFKSQHTALAVTRKVCSIFHKIGLSTVDQEYDHFIFYEDVFPTSFAELVFRVQKMRLDVYRTFNGTNIGKKSHLQYWLYYHNCNRIIVEDIRHYLGKFLHTLGTNFISLKLAVPILKDYIKRWVVPYPKVICKNNRFIITRIIRRHVESTIFKHMIMDYGRQFAIDIQHCGYCFIRPINYLPEIRPQDRNFREDNFNRYYCSKRCADLDDFRLIPAIRDAKVREIKEAQVQKEKDYQHKYHLLKKYGVDIPGIKSEKIKKMTKKELEKLRDEEREERKNITKEAE